MIDPYLRELLESPIDNAERAGRVWLPRGKAPKPKAMKAEYHGEEMPKLSTGEVRERAKAALDTKRAQLLAYYAKIDLAPERVAEHLKLPVDEVRRRLRELRALSA